MTDNEVLRRRARELQETGRHYLQRNQRIALPTSGSAGLVPPVSSANPNQSRLVKCKTCLQERVIPIGENEFKCAVCGAVNDVSS